MPDSEFDFIPDLERVLDELKPALRNNIGRLAEALLGERNKKVSTKNVWRWGSKGSLAIHVAGKKKGACVNYETGWTGDPLDLIRDQRRVDFIEAVKFGCRFVGIKIDAQPAPEDPEAARKRQQKRIEEEAEAAADEANRIRIANQLWKAAEPITGTIAETYLKQERGIPRPAGGWPDAIRFHPSSNAMILAGTDDAGAIRFVHRVHLTPDGCKITKAEADARRLRDIKVTNGVTEGAYVRLPGDPKGPLLHAEGPETGLSVWVATGYETRILSGGITRSIPGTGRINVICRDDDKHQSPADKALKRANADWMREGLDVRIATPWPMRQQDKSDFNDVIREAGIDAIRPRINAAVNPPHRVVHRVSATKGRDILRKAISGFYREAAEWNSARAKAEKAAKADLTAKAVFPVEVAIAKAAKKRAAEADKAARKLAAVRPVTEDSKAALAAAEAAARVAHDWAEQTAELSPTAKRAKRKVERDINATAKAQAIAKVGAYPVHGIAVDVGGAKTQIALEFVEPTIDTLRTGGDKSTIVIAIPEHALGDQQVARLAGMPGGNRVTSAVWRSRKAKNAETPMCLDLDAVADAEEAFADVQTAVCRKTLPGGEVRECHHYNECLFQKQREQKPDVWFVPHELLFMRKPEAIEKPAIVIVDESAWQDGILGSEKLLLETLVTESTAIPGDTIGPEELKFNRELLFDALLEIAPGQSDDPKTIRAANRSIVRQLISQPSTAATSYSLEWARKKEADIWPGMPARQRKEAVAAVTHNKVVAKLGRLWKAVGALVAADGPEQSGWIKLGISKTNDGTAPAIFLKGRKDVHESWHVPTLMLDATFQPELVRHFWPSLEMKADVRLTAPHQHIKQVVDRSYSKGQLGILRQADDPEEPDIANDEPDEVGRGLRAVHATICREARRYAPGRVLAVVQKDVEDLLPTIGPLPANLELAHHNAVAGKDGWGPGPGRKGVVAQIVVGRTAPSPSIVESMAEAVTGAAVDRIQGWYPKAEAAREMTDGTYRPAEADQHPDPVAEAIRWSITEGQLVQILGRPRGVNRTDSNRVDILVMTNAPLPVPVEMLVSADDLAPSPDDLQMAAGGVAFGNPTDAAAAYPQLWNTRSAAKSAFSRFDGPRLGANSNKGVSIRECTQPPADIAYRRAGAGTSKAKAIVDLAIVPDPQTWISDRIGTLAHFALTVPRSPDLPVQPIPLPKMIVGGPFTFWHPDPVPTEPFELPAWLADFFLDELRKVGELPARGSG